MELDLQTTPEQVLAVKSQLLFGRTWQDPGYTLVFLWVSPKSKP